MTISGVASAKVSRRIGDHIKAALTRQDGQCTEDYFKEKVGDECYNRLVDLQPFVTQEKLEDVCTEECVGKLLGIYESGECEDDDAVKYFEIICSENEDDQYCYPLADEEIGPAVMETLWVCSAGLSTGSSSSSSSSINESVICTDNCSQAFEDIVDNYGCCLNLYVYVAEEIAGVDVEIEIPYEQCDVSDPGMCDTVEPSDSGSVCGPVLLLVVAVSIMAAIVENY